MKVKILIYPSLGTVNQNGMSNKTTNEKEKIILFCDRSMFCQTQQRSINIQSNQLANK